MKKKLGILVALAFLAAIGLLVWSTGGKMGGVYINKYAVSADGSTMEIQSAVAGSMGCVRALGERDDGNRKYLTFYSTFGLNSTIGAHDEFQLTLSPACDEIYVYSGEDGYKLRLRKNKDTNEWERVK